MKAASDGNAEDTSFLFRLHSRMVIPPQSNDPTNNIPRTLLEPNIVPIDESGAVVVDDKEPFVENGITFIPGNSRIPCLI